MNIKRIVVDELPKSCISCQFVEHFEMLQSTCSITHHIAYRHKRPEWCPLELEEVCEWVHKKFDEYWDEYTPITCCKTGEEKEKFETIRIVGMDMEYKFCPSCGRRIVYKESE